MTIRYSAFALVLAGCVVNGKAYGPGASSPSVGSTASSSESSNAASSSTAPASTNSAAAGSSDGTTSSENAPYANAPADPWAGVAGDQPKRRADDKWTVRTHDFACTAAHDHCLETDAWFIVDQQPLAMQKAQAEVYVFGPDEPFGAWNAVMKNHGPDHYIAYRTVPATRSNLTPGVLAFGFKDDHPTSGRNAVEQPWAYGKVATVDVELGFYTLEGGDKRLRLSAARVAVLRWEPGGKVEIVGGKRRNELAVRATDVFLPEP